MIDSCAFLYFGDGQIVKFHSGKYKPDGGALMIGKSGIEGWWSAPNLKVDMVERSAGNGGHDVASDRILYASRTVTVHFDVVGDARGEILDTVMRLSRANGLPVKFRVVDDWSDTFVCGYIHDEYGATWSARHQTGTLTIVCPRPERFSTVVQSAQLMPVSRSRGGLSYGTDGTGLSYGPGNKGLSYGVAADGGERNLTVLSNHGSYPAYPTLVVNGPFPDGVEIQTGVGGSIRYSGAIGMVPLTIQCDPRNVAASMGGVDVGRYLVGRDLPSIPSGGSLSLRLVTAGAGWVTCSVRDTYL